MIVALWFFVLALPKAGTYVGEVPVTVASLVVMAYATYHFLYPGYPPIMAEASRRFTRVHLVVVWILTLSLLVNLSRLTVAGLTTWLLLVASPLAFHAGLRVRHPRRALAVVLIATVAVGGYALVQNLVGVEEVAVPGITHVNGENLIEDNPIRTPSGTLKSPSTYHNGNLAAAFLLLGLGCALVAPRLRRELRTLAALAALAAVVGVGVSLARAAALGIVVAVLVALMPSLRPPWLGRRTARVTAVLFIGAGILLGGYILTGSETFLVERFVSDSIHDPTGAGRTLGYEGWLSGLAALEPLDFIAAVLFGDWSIDVVDDKIEGVVALTAIFGLPAMVAFGSMLVLPCRMIRQRLGSNGTVLWLGLVASSAMFLVDSTFLFPPTLMNWCLVAGLGVRLSSDMAAPSVASLPTEPERRLELAS